MRVEISTVLLLCLLRLTEASPLSFPNGFRTCRDRPRCFGRHGFSASLAVSASAGTEPTKDTGVEGNTIKDPSGCIESLTTEPSIAQVHLLQTKVYKSRKHLTDGPLASQVAAGGAFGAGSYHGQEDGQVARAVGNLTLPCIPYCREVLEFYVAYGAGLAYVHVAKCAGSTIEAAFGIDTTHNHCTASMLEACRTPALTIPLVASFRNPFDRAVSAYSQYVAPVTRENNPLWEPAVHSFQQWLQLMEQSYIDSLPLEYCQSQSRQVDCVFSASGEDLSQYHVHTETLDDDWEKLRDAFPKLPRLPSAENVGDHDAWCSFYGREEAEMVARMYAADFKFLSISSNIADYCSG